MDWGFTNVVDFNGDEYRAACFAMICHHCGQRYVEFFPNAKQENLFIGMMHGSRYMGIPKYILTDNMKSVVLKRDFEGHPVWQRDYEAFMRAVGFQTKLCKPRHPFTKGKVERLVRFVKENFLLGRVFWNVTDLNWSALEWCNEQNSIYHRATSCVPQKLHFSKCIETIRPLYDDPALQYYLCPERRISFDGFVNYEGRRFGVPYSYRGSTVRVMRDAGIGEAVGFNVYWDGAVQISSEDPYTGAAPVNTVLLPSDGSQYVPQAGDVIACDDGSTYIITDVSRWNKSVFAEGPLPELPEPTCDWSSFPGVELPEPEVRRYQLETGDYLFIRNIYEIHRMQYTLTNLAGNHPDTSKDGKLKYGTARERLLFEST